MSERRDSGSATDLARRLEVPLDDEALETRVTERLERSRATARVPGFRRGKVPMAELRRRYGRRVRQEQAEAMAQSAIREALAAEGLRPVAAPAIVIEGLATAADEAPAATAVATFEVFPTLPPLDLAALEIRIPEVTIDDEDIDRMVFRLRQEGGRWLPVTRPSRAGDRVALLLSAQGARGRWPRKGRRRVEQIVGDDDGPAAFLGTALESLAARQQASHRLTLPDDHEIAAVTGPEADVSFLVAEVREHELPELDDAFLNALGFDDGDVAALRGELAETMREEAAEAEREERERAVEAALLGLQPDLPLPASLLDAQIERLRAAAEGPRSDDALEDEARELLGVAFLVAELARQHGLGIDPGRLWARTRELAEHEDDPEEALDRLWGDGEAIQEIQEDLLRADVTEKVLALARVAREPVPFRDLARERRARGSRGDPTSTTETS